MKLFIKMIDRVNEFIFQLISILFGLIALLTIYQVFARYVLNDPLVWSEELIRYLMIWIVLLGTAIALRKGMLISVELVLHLVPKTIKKFMELMIIGFNVVFLFFLIKYGFIIMETLHEQTTGALEIPVAWTYAAIPVGACLSLLNCVVVWIELFTGKKEDQHGGSVIL